jgi:hypothetical protein
VASPTVRGSSDAVISGRASEVEPDEQYEVDADEYEEEDE